MNDILIVDDEDGIRETLSDIITLKTNHICEMSNDGLDAIEKTRKTRYNFILMDIRMPGMDGIDAYERMIRDRPRTNVVLMTGTDISSLSGRLPAGARVMTKPIDIPSLLRLIDDSTNERR